MTTILDKAATATTQDRQRDYGHPLENHSRTAALWSTYLGVSVTAEDVCMLNILQKVSRGINAITDDTLVDIAGYARNIEMVRERRALLAAADDV